MLVQFNDFFDGIKDLYPVRGICYRWEAAEVLKALSKKSPEELAEIDRQIVAANKSAGSSMIVVLSTHDVQDLLDIRTGFQTIPVSSVQV